MTNTLYDALIAPHADNAAPFLITDSGVVLSYAGFVRRVAQLAHALCAQGVVPGDPVVAQLAKHSDTVALYAACLQTGAVYLPLNTAYTQAELAYFIADAMPRLVVCSPAMAEEISAVCAAQHAGILTLEADGEGSLAQAADAMPEHFETVSRSAEDLAALLYTSGTTGRSKGAMLTHKNLLSNARVLVDLWQITNRDRLVHALPIFHTHGLFVALNTALLAGAAVRFMARFDVDAVVDYLPRATLMMGVPTFYSRLLSSRGFSRKTCAGMRLFISGSAPLLAETHVAFAARTGHEILERYGMTETNMISSNPYEGARVAGTVGYALPGVEVKITNPETGETLSSGEIGMIELRGDNVFQGYRNMPEKTGEDLRANGYFITGDLGTMAPDGRISIVGRQKDLIISGGYNIYPKEIEDQINAVPGVLESAVFGLPDDDFGEVVAAAIVLTAGASCTDLAIAAAIKPQLARFKHPRRYILVPDLPRNAMGKVQKNILRETFAFTGAAAAGGARS